MSQLKKYKTENSTIENESENKKNKELQSKCFRVKFHGKLVGTATIVWSLGKRNAGKQ